MATLSSGRTWVNNESITSAKLNATVNDATISGIVNADIAAGAAIADSKLAQITTASKVNYSALTGTPTALLELIFPVGIVVTLGVSTNPATLFGVGTWSPIKGKVIVGIHADESDYANGDFRTLDNTGGAKTVTLTAAQSGLPAHVHLVSGGTTGGAGNNFCKSSTGGAAINTDSVSAENASESHTNLQPYIVKYVWQRVS